MGVAAGGSGLYSLLWSVSCCISHGSLYRSTVEVHGGGGEPGFEFSGMAVLAMQNCGYSCLNPRNWGGKIAKASTKSRAYESRAHEGKVGGKSSHEQLNKLGANEGGGYSNPSSTSNRVSTLEPDPYAKESIPAHRGRPTASEQRQVNELMEKHGCHTCGTKDPGTKSGNAVADHQPPQSLDDPIEFYPHCIHCARRQGGDVRQEKAKRGK